MSRRSRRSVNFQLRMYLLNANTVPSSNYFSAVECRCLALTLNIAVRCRKEFNFYKQLRVDRYHEFENNIKKGHLFCYNGDHHILRLSSNSTQVLFRLLWKVWVQIISEHLGEGERLILKTNLEDECSTNKYYDENKGIYVTETQLVDFCHVATKQAVFVAYACGSKYNLDVVPQAYVNMNKKLDVELFCAQSTECIKQYLLEKTLNTSGYPATITNDLVTHQHLTDLVMAFDIAMEFTPVQKDISFVTNGFLAKKSIAEKMKIKKSIMQRRRGNIASGEYVKNGFTKSFLNLYVFVILFAPDNRRLLISCCT